MLSPSTSWRLVSALALLAPVATHAQSCSALTQNVLTSAGCPAKCSTSPCVLFSPSQKEQCQVTNAAGPCLADDTIIAGCNVTYQCLDSIVDKRNKWYLALTPSSQQDTVTTAAVTEVKQLTYPASGVYTVQVAGGLGRNARGEIKNVVLDDSLFATPQSVKSFYLSEMNLQKAIANVDFSKVFWSSVGFTNANLKEVPVGLAKLSLQYVELSKNYISNISDATPFKNVSTLNLAFNDLTDLTIALPAVETLNLTGNPLTKIPDAIFSMAKLKKLSLLGTKLSNVALTETQLTFLQSMPTLETDLTVTTCPNGTIPKTLNGGSSSVCIPGSLPTEAPTTTKSSSNTATIVGIVVGGVVVVAIIAFLMCRRKRQHDNSSYTSLSKGGDTSLNGTDFTNGSGSDTFGSSNIWNDPDLLAVRIEYRDIEPIKLLSRGGFGEVWLGLYMNENVAIKRLLGDKKTMTDALAFAAEIKIMARLDHPKVVRFIGVAWTNALTIQAVTEFMDCGDLRSLLDSSRASSLTWANLKCQIAIDVADALVYLHTLNPKLIHRDLKSRNVLIDANTGAKLSDFGISRNRSVEETMTAGVGTARWIAPEVILGGHYTEFADIYSFGVVLSELDTTKSPFHDAVNTNGAKMPDVTILQLVSAGKLQPSFEPTCPESIVKLARACMSFDPAQRPSAIHISYELRKILKDEL